jgi:hypothetical protein
MALGLKPEPIMDDQLLLHVYHRLFDPGKVLRPAGCTFSDSIVVLIHFLATLRDRSAHWAVVKRNWPLWMRRLAAPSYSQLMRRLATPPALRLIDQLNDEFRAALPRGAEKVCDGKPLVVGGFSKDPDAGVGRLPGGGWGRGYKVHVVVDAASGAVDAFAITRLGAGEPTVARERLVPRLVDLRGSVLRGDSNYDSNPLYHAVAGRGGRLVATRKKPGTGLGHHGRQHPDRLRAIEELERSPAALRVHRRHRVRVEQGLAHLTNVPFGLAPLPNFVRRLRRVSLWVTAKVALYHLYLILRRRRTLAA